MRVAELALQVGFVAERGGEVEVLRASMAWRVLARARVAWTRGGPTATDLVSEGRVATHFQTRPMRAASSAGSLSPSIASAIAWPRPTRRGSSQVPPQSGIRPIFAKAWTKLADRAATTMSQHSAKFAPAPAATPLTAATTGTGIERMRNARGL